MTDVCECPRNRKCSCESIRAYTAACFRQGVKLKWEEAYHCRSKLCEYYIFIIQLRETLLIFITNYFVKNFFYTVGHCVVFV